MTIVQIIMLTLMPSMALVALLLCKPVFRPRLAAYNGEDRDLIPHQSNAETEQVARI
jgi:hypothetical protein